MPSQQPPTILIITLALAGLLGAAAAGLVLARPQPETPPARPAALPVQTQTLDLQDGYTLERAFSGQVQASRQSELGFESAGRPWHASWSTRARRSSPASCWPS